MAGMKESVRKACALCPTFKCLSLQTADRTSVIPCPRLVGRPRQEEDGLHHHHHHISNDDDDDDGGGDDDDNNDDDYNNNDEDDDDDDHHHHRRRRRHRRIERRNLSSFYNLLTAPRTVKWRRCIRVQSRATHKSICQSSSSMKRTDYTDPSVSPAAA